jgi:hypothetical protein
MHTIDKISTGHEDLGFFIDDIGVWNDSWKYHTLWYLLITPLVYSDYPFGIFWLPLWYLLITPLVYSDYPGHILIRKLDLTEWYWKVPLMRKDVERVHLSPC